MGPARLNVTFGARALPESGTRREVHSESIAGGANALIPRSARRAFLRFRYCRRSRHSPNPVALDVLGRARMGPSDAGDFVMGHASTISPGQIASSDCVWKVAPGGVQPSRTSTSTIRSAVVVLTNGPISCSVSV